MKERSPQPDSELSFGVRTRNIRSMASMEAEERLKRSLGERVGDAIASAAGQLWFLGLHAVWFSAWILLNLGFLPGLMPFDPYPFSFLTFVVSLEAIFLSLFILISQGREMRQADLRAKLDLQINLLAENETTKLIQMVRELCLAQGLPVAHDPELEELVEATNPEGLMKEVKEACETPNGTDGGASS